MFEIVLQYWVILFSFGKEDKRWSMNIIKIMHLNSYLLENSHKLNQRIFQYIL